MSYCVNCGVKLDPSLKYCPLCNTPVINPHDLSKMQPISPFPKEKGQVEVVRRKDLAILLSVSLTAAGLCSLLLNLLVFRQHLWSLYVIGACVLIWVMSIPAVIYTKLPIYLSLLFDGLAVMLYQFLIGFNTTDHSWFFVPPNGKTDKYRINLCEVDVDRFNSRSKRLIKVFLRTTGLFVCPIDIFRRIGLFRQEPYHSGSGHFCNLLGGKFSVAGMCKIYDY